MKDILLTPQEVEKSGVITPDQAKSLRSWSTYRLKKYPVCMLKLAEFKKEWIWCPYCETYFKKPQTICAKKECAPKWAEYRKSIQEKRKQTSLKKYGTDHPTKAKSTREKMQNTMLERYGVPHALQSDKIKKEMKENNILKYGVEHPAQTPESKEKASKFHKDHWVEYAPKVKETNLKRYGVAYPSQRPEVVEKMKETNLKRYGVDNIMKDKEFYKKVKEEHPDTFGFGPKTREKVSNIINEKYGTKTPFENTNVQAAAKDTQKKFREDPLYSSKIKEKTLATNFSRYGTENPAQSHIRDFQNWSNKEFWIDNFGEYKGQTLFLDTKKIAEHFGVNSYSSIWDRAKKMGLNYLKKPERLKTQQSIFDAIKTQNKIFNDRKIIAPKELDIYLPDAKLAIEYNGLAFHSQGAQNHEMFPNISPNEHIRKTEECAAKGIQLFHIFENDDLGIWLSMIHSKLGLNARIYARKCEIREIPNKDTQEFQDFNHIQGYCVAKICIGLFYNSELVAIMSFGAPRFNRKYEYELIRFCTLRNHNVIGGASKLWNYFLKKYAPKSVISYANLRFSQGGIYEKLGFAKIAQSNPNYFYFKLEDGILESRHKYQKHRLANVLENFDPQKSETENMFANGYRRIFDCGNLTYVWGSK